MLKVDYSLPSPFRCLADRRGTSVVLRNICRNVGARFVIRAVMAGGAEAPEDEEAGMFFAVNA
jgi:hypothetical protein